MLSIILFSFSVINASLCRLKSIYFDLGVVNVKPYSKYNVCFFFKSLDAISEKNKIHESNSNGLDTTLGRSVAF